MRAFQVEIVTDGYARAVLKKKGNGIALEVDQELTWDRDGLLRLSAALKGAAETLGAK